MPELPEVETVVRDLQKAGVPICVIRNVTVHHPKLIVTPSLKRFVNELRGQKITTISRRGKYIVMTLGNDQTLIVHLRMSGRLQVVDAKDHPLTKHDHIILTLDDSRELRYHDPRKFGRWWMGLHPETILGKLGPEPLGKHFTVIFLATQLRQNHRALKPLLLDQNFLAGLGNIYVDEALWTAHLHPLQPANTLTRSQYSNLHQAIRTVLQSGIRHRGTSLGHGKSNFHSIKHQTGKNQNHLHVYQRTGKPCHRCQTPIQKITVAQRGTHLCPKCQNLVVGFRL